MKFKTIVAVILILLPCLGSVAQTGTTAFTDKRDNKTYRTVKIGKLTWMAENLNYAVDSSWCYNDDNDNCAKYGRLYTWNSSMTACPVGWRLPDTSDWNDLVAIAGGKKTAGKKLKSKTGWADVYGKPMGNNTDDIGFSALPSGYRLTDGNFRALGNWGNWWSATEYSYNCAYYRSMDYGPSDVNEDWYNMGSGLSLRCVRDEWISP